MNFGRVADPSGIQHSMPERTRVSPRLDKRRSPWRLYVGAPAWGDRGFVGKIYPAGTKPGDYLYHYARQFGCIELNATFYRVPDPDTVQRWHDHTPPDFIFCPKFPQQISNHRHLSPQAGILDDFMSFTYNLGDRLGTAFLQLPQYFSTDRIADLRDFLGRLPENLPLAIEFRHASWFGPGGLGEDVFDLLAQHAAGAVITDTSGRRDVLHFAITGQDVLVRFTGNRLHDTDYQRLESWARQLGQWEKLPVRRIFFMIHQPEEHWCVDSAIHFASKLNSRIAAALKIPVPLSGAQGQLDLF